MQYYLLELHLRIGDYTFYEYSVHAINTLNPTEYFHQFILNRFDEGEFDGEDITYNGGEVVEDYWDTHTLYESQYHTVKQFLPHYIAN